jgi:hypothetical protein
VVALERRMAAPEARLARVVKASRCSPREMALSEIHHAAFDNHLIGIDPDGRLHVSERLLMLHDGPLLEQSPKAIAGTTMRCRAGASTTPLATGSPRGSSSSRASHQVERRSSSPSSSVRRNLMH